MNPLAPPLQKIASADDADKDSPRLVQLREFLRASPSSLLELEREHWLRSRSKVPAKSISEKERERLRTIFDMIDIDGSSTLEIDELKEAMAFVSIPISQSELIERMKAIDSNYDGVISFEEFSRGFGAVSEWDVLIAIRQRVQRQRRAALKALERELARLRRRRPFETEAIAKLQRQSERLRAQLEARTHPSDIPFSLWVPAFHRLRTVEGIISQGYAFMLENERRLRSERKLKWGEGRQLETLEARRAAEEEAKAKPQGSPRRASTSLPPGMEGGVLPSFMSPRRSICQPRERRDLDSPSPPLGAVASRSEHYTPQVSQRAAAMLSGLSPDLTDILRAAGSEGRVRRMSIISATPEPEPAEPQAESKAPVRLEVAAGRVRRRLSVSKEAAVTDGTSLRAYWRRTQQEVHTKNMTKLGAASPL